MNLVQLLNVESGKVIAKLENDRDDHLKKDYPDSFREKRLQIYVYKETMETYNGIRAKALEKMVKI